MFTHNNNDPFKKMFLVLLPWITKVFNNFYVVAQMIISTSLLAKISYNHNYLLVISPSYSCNSIILFWKVVARNFSRARRCCYYYCWNWKAWILSQWQNEIINVTICSFFGVWHFSLVKYLSPSPTSNVSGKYY